MAAVEISYTSIRAYSWHVVIVRPGDKHFLTSNFADGKNIHFTIRILSRPTLSITVTETMEVESGSHRSQTILLSARSTSTKAPIYCRYSAISGTTTGTSLSLTITEHPLHRTVERTFDVKD